VRTDIAIVGAGPAALAAADVLASFAVDVTLIDEQPAAGGQIFRQPPARFRVARWLPERVYRPGKELLACVTANERLQWKFGTTVLAVAENRRRLTDTSASSYSLTLASRGAVEQLDARQVLIAPGCYDMPVCFPGSTLPGVMAAGGIQAFVKSQQLVPGDRFVFVGTHPLQLIVADQIRRAGGTVVEVIFAQSFAGFIRSSASPDVLGRAGKLAYIAGVLARLRAAGVRVRFGETIVAASGESSLGAVSIARVGASGAIDRDARREIRCDRLGLCFGFLTSSELARQVGVRHRWLGDGGGWVSECDEWMGTNKPGIFVAGEITGIAGADAAMEAGRLAAFGLLRERGLLESRAADRAATPVRRRLHRLQNFARRLRAMSDPGWQLLEQMLTADAIVCKCEEITAGAFADYLSKNSAVRSANAAKLGCRIGMGLCQGRYCNYYVTQLLAQRASLAQADVGPFTAQWPAKPVRVGTIAR
jgi:D-hydroxyproline dehydrogenase subunit alpha